MNILAAQFVDSYGSLLPRIPGMELSVERFKPRLTGRMQLSAECGRPSPGDGVSRAQCVCATRSVEECSLQQNQGAVLGP